MDPVIYTVEKSEFDVGGVKYDLSYVCLELSTNGIPTYTVGISAEPSQGASNVNVVHTLSIKDLSETYRELQQKAIELTKCNLDIKLKASGAEALKSKIETRIKLKDWLLTHVGMTQITTTNVFSVVLTVSHPAYRLKLETGSIFNGTGVLDFVDKSKSVKDPVDALSKAAELCKQANNGGIKQKIIEDAIAIDTDFKKLSEMRDEINNRLTNVITNIGDYLEWDTGRKYVKHGVDIPGESVLSSVVDGIKYALLTDCVHGMTQRSCWDTLTSIIAPLYATEVLGTYYQDHLVVCPSFPWKDTEICKFLLRDELAYQVLLPGQDTQPIFGYIAQCENMVPAGGLITVQMQGSEQTATIPNQYAYIPTTSKQSVGSISYRSLPTWMDTARMFASIKKKTNGVTTASVNFTDDLAVPIPMSSGENEQLKKWNPGVNMHLGNIFMLEYKAGVQAMIACPFFNKVDGKVLFPGQRLLFEAEDKPIFYGTVDEVKHTIVCPESSANTVIRLSHCTFVGAEDKRIIGESPIGPYYVATGKIEWK